jgi:hypothetical protein
MSIYRYMCHHFVENPHRELPTNLIIATIFTTTTPILYFVHFTFFLSVQNRYHCTMHNTRPSSVHHTSLCTIFCTRSHRHFIGRGQQQSPLPWSLRFLAVVVAPFGDFGKNADKINDHESQNDESGTPPRLPAR